MSRSLSIECDPVDQPAATDPLERSTWCAMRIRIGGRTVTRVWDKSIQDERTLLYVPAFPIAEWVVSNWWMLLHEPLRTAELPQSSLAHLPWIKRHCLRSAESGLLLPSLYIFNDGRGIRAQWVADERGACPHMPGEFTDTGSDVLEEATVRDSLAEFVDSVLDRLEGRCDERVIALRENWQAVRGADADEANYCIAAGRLGLDPYDPSQVGATVAEWVETELADPDRPLIRDLTESADPDTVIGQWKWIAEINAFCPVGPLRRRLPISNVLRGGSPARHAYHLASEVRRAAGASAWEPIVSVDELAATACGCSFSAQDRNDAPGRTLQALVGWADADQIVLAGPRPTRSDSRRFLDARGIYHALFACHQSERLVTRAFTWDQQASRAFAAELLAPRAALANRTNGVADPDTVRDLATCYDVSTAVVSNQLRNAEVPLVEE